MAQCALALAAWTPAFAGVTIGMERRSFVMPAHAGIQGGARHGAMRSLALAAWTPAFAGVTIGMERPGDCRGGVRAP